MEKESKFKDFWNWYVKGEYHCDQCEYCWEERSYEGECDDCGCVLRGDLRDTCRWLPFVRFLVGWPRKRKIEFEESRRYEGIDEFYREEQRREQILAEEIRKMLATYEIVYHPAWDKPWIDENGEKRWKSTTVIDKDELIRQRIGRMQINYENEAHPYVHKTLRQEWQELIQKTWNRFLDLFRPYLPRRKRRKKNVEKI